MNPFRTPEARRLAILFAVVYFSQGMWYLPKQAITIVLKDRGLTAGQVADFYLVATLPWLVKPVYGLISDFVPLFGYRRRSYFFLTCGVAGLAALLLAATDSIANGSITAMTLTLPLLGTLKFTVVSGVWLFTLMALGLAFGDVLTDATMVEKGRPLGLTGAFQSVQWTATNICMVLAGLIGGMLAAARDLRLAFVIAAIFPLLTLAMIATFVPERPMPANRQAFAATWKSIRGAFGERDMWAVAGFIFFYTFSPSFGPAFTFYQTDVLKFSQEFIGVLDALASVGQIAGAILYALVSRRYRLKTLVIAAIGISVAGTLAFLLYRDRTSAVLIQTVFGMFGMMTVLAFLDLAAKACPPRVEATFFALLMSVFNGGVQVSENVGARLYDSLGFQPLILISAAVTALGWALVPVVRIERIEAKAVAGSPPATAG